MPRTFFIDANRHDGTPVVVEYSFRPGESPSYSPYSGADGGDPAEVEIVRAWLKENDHDPNAPDVTPTDAERDSWCDLICDAHVDEPDEDD